jgi:hypothetical protein
MYRDSKSATSPASYRNLIREDLRDSRFYFPLRTATLHPRAKFPALENRDPRTPQRLAPIQKL